MHADPAQPTRTDPALPAGPKFEALQFVPPPAKHWPMIPGLLSAAFLFVVGFVILAKVRRNVRAEEVVATVGRFSQSTRIITALTCLIGGYHLAAWSLDERVLPLRVAVERGWLVPLIGLLAIGASCGVDFVQRKFDSEEKS